MLKLGLNFRISSFAANLKLNFMYSSEDLERFYFQYQTEGVPKGISIQTFCLTNQVPYNLFSKWYKDTRKKIVEVQVDGCPTETVSPVTPSASIVPPVVGCPSPTRIWLELRMSNGLHISQKNLSYPDLLRMIEKLEGLC